ncbi:MAG: hypothetical protein KME17_05595 [Cyanosarcina radialis HA8281-LM2]|nr:hypothetical protein [Cyanosarcina radialis HA8281-LM2]
MFQLLYPIIRIIQPLLVPACFLLAWTLAILFFWSLWTAIRDTVGRAKVMHQIPCTGCKFFTNDYHLKCTVHPHIANSEAAIGCSDYRRLEV